MRSVSGFVSDIVIMPCLAVGPFSLHQHETVISRRVLAGIPTEVIRCSLPGNTIEAGSADDDGAAIAAPALRRLRSSGYITA